jgi:hypothetical protein
MNAFGEWSKLKLLSEYRARMHQLSFLTTTYKGHLAMPFVSFSCLIIILKKSLSAWRDRFYWQ